MEHLTAKRQARFSRVSYPKIGGDFKDELIADLAIDKYHSDRSKMSSTGVRKMLMSPKHFRHWIAGLDDEDSEKDYFRYGRAVHMFLLEPKKFQKCYVVMPDFGPMQSSKNRAKRDEWIAEQPSDAMILKEEELDSLLDIFDSLSEHDQAGQMLRNGRPEVTGFWKHKETGVHCRVRPDYISTDSEGNVYIIDLKTTKNASPGLFSHDCANHGYHIQLAFYYDGIAQITGKEPSSCAIIAVEKTPPYGVHVYWMIDDWIEHGRRQYEEALRRYVEAREKDKWEGPQGSGMILMPPAWLNSNG